VLTRRTRLTHACVARAWRVSTSARVQVWRCHRAMHATPSRHGVAAVAQRDDSDGLTRRRVETFCPAVVSSRYDSRYAITPCRAGAQSRLVEPVRNHALSSRYAIARSPRRRVTRGQGESRASLRWHSSHINRFTQHAPRTDHAVPTHAERAPAPSLSFAGGLIYSPRIALPLERSPL
jgi:hypothetical protein